MDPHGAGAPRRGSTQSYRAFSVEDAQQELDNDRVASSSSSARHRPPSSSRRRSRQRVETRPSIAEVHFTDDPAVGAGSTPILESHLHVHHHHGAGGLPGDGLTYDDVEPVVSPTGAEQPEDVDGDDSGSTLIQTTDNDDEFDDTSDTASIESFTLRERQDAINETHPFGIRIWKPALYKKDRSVQRLAEGDIHSTPGKKVTFLVQFGNYAYSILFGVPLFIITQLGACFCLGLFSWSASAREYGRTLYELGNYLLYPFGKFVQLEQDEQYALEDEGEGRSIGEYEEWRTGADRGRLFFGPTPRRQTRSKQRSSLDPISEQDHLLGEASDSEPLLGHEAGSSSVVGSISSDLEDGLPIHTKRRLFGRGNWTIGRVMFYFWFYFLVYPAMLIVASICWFMVFAIPMARVNVHLCKHLRKRPLALSFHRDGPVTRSNQEADRNSTILLCTYRAFGLNYYKYTVDGTNVVLMNLMFIVFLTIFDQFVLERLLGPTTFITTPGVIFVLALSSIIPLAYFIGQAVASISAQSSMGMGAAINAFFSTIVEIFLYCVALKEGKGRLVEGSIIGSILAGVLVMPGISMCSGAIKRKTQRYNPKSAGVSSTMLLFAIIAVFAPTLFYQIYGSYQLFCVPCGAREDPVNGATCRRCQFFLDPLTNDAFYRSAVKPFSYICAVLLFVSYSIGLWFTLRTHAAMIWQSPGSAPAPNPATSTDTGAVNTIVVDGTSDGTTNSGGITTTVLAVNDNLSDDYAAGGMSDNEGGSVNTTFKFKIPTILGGHTPDVPQSVPLRTLSAESTTSTTLLPTVEPMTAKPALQVRSVGELPVKKATAVTSGASYTTGPMSPNNSGSRRGSLRNFLRRGNSNTAGTGKQSVKAAAGPTAEEEAAGADANHGGAASGGHDAPNWSKAKSAVVLLGATVLYAVIAEILVDTVDVVLDSVAIDEKFLGITLFALVPNTTEFLNAISFAMNGNIALSMEIGSAYVLQVCLLQIPALILFSAFTISGTESMRDYAFTLVFPRWDLVVVVLCVFLLSYIYAEGRSNYFKGSILLLSYIAVMCGFWYSGQTGEAQLSSIGNSDGMIVPPANHLGAGPVLIIPGYQFM
ncbi:Sodium/calcium exchanger protein-domain-containing protein [Limtongia smithiae]|uniref:Sodium/calcium exchanger protein-domain-containing protein n=1 Tax=Limtongia smithiae TaxID=1125753 RepID=UPI0034CE45B0